MENDEIPPRKSKKATKSISVEVSESTLKKLQLMRPMYAVHLEVKGRGAEKAYCSQIFTKGVDLMFEEYKKQILEI